MQWSQLNYHRLFMFDKPKIATSKLAVSNMAYLFFIAYNHHLLSVPPASFFFRGMHNVRDDLQLSHFVG